MDRKCPQTVNAFRKHERTPGPGPFEVMEMASAGEFHLCSP